MNYLEQINAFNQWVETNYLPVNSQLLWFKLMNLCNRCGWREWIVVDNQRLMSMMQMESKNTFIRCRDKLVASGLVDFAKGKKGSPNKYRINSIKNELEMELKTTPKTELKTALKTALETGHINKHKQNKTKQYIPPISPKGESDPFFDFAGDDAELKKALQDFAIMRKTIKKPLTDRAKERIVTQLQKLTSDKAEMVDILDQSIVHNWQDVYALKGEVNYGKHSGSGGGDAGSGTDAGIKLKVVEL